MQVEFNQSKLDEMKQKEEGIPSSDINIKDDSLIVSYLDNCWEEARKAKEDHAEIQVLANMRQIDGTYDPEKLSAIREIGGSEVFMMITNAKCKNAANWIDELIFQPNVKPYDIAPTPIPELPEYVMEEIFKEAIMGIIPVLAKEAQESGVAPNNQAIMSKVAEILPKIQDNLKDIAYEKAVKLAETITREVDDKLIEGGWYSALKKTIPNVIMHTGFMSGPTPRKRSTIKIRPEASGKLVPHIVEDVIPTWESCNPLNIYPAPDSTDINDGYLFERIKLTPMMLQELIGVPSYDEDEIRSVLDEIKEGKLGDWLSVDQDKADIVDAPSPVAYDSKKVDCLKFCGSVCGEEILSWSDSVKDQNGDKIDKILYYNIIAYKIGSHVISIQFNTDPLGRKPYYKASFEELDGSFWGKGLPQVISDVQNVCNAMARAIVNNAAMGSGPQVERNIDRIPPAARADNVLVPWKVWDSTSDMMASNAPALKFYQPPMVVERLMGVYVQFSKIADEHSGVPAYAHGDTAVGGAGNTASGLSMLMGSAARGIKAIIKAIDEKIIKQSVERQYHWLTERNEFYGMICDYQIVSGGTMAALAREQMSARRIEFMNATANPIDVQIMGTEGRKYVLSETAESINMNLDKYIKKQEVNQTNQQQEQGQPGLAATGASAKTLDVAGNPVVGQDFKQ
jgi:hypothetical protein